MRKKTGGVKKMNKIGDKKFTYRCPNCGFIWVTESLFINGCPDCGFSYSLNDEVVKVKFPKIYNAWQIQKCIYEEKKLESEEK